MKKIWIMVGAFIVCGKFSIASAYEFNFLNDSPVAYYTDQDWALYKAAARDALDNKKDGTKVTWKNPVNGHGGYFIPTHTTKKNGKTCRTLKIFNYGKSRTDASTYQVCKYPNGWKIPGDQ
jgi:surface antigen